jgi:HEAT repeats
MADQPPDGRDFIRWSIRRFGSELAVTILVKELQNPDANIQLVTLRTLKFFESQATAAIPALEQKLQSPNKTIALAAADAVLAVDAHHVQALVYRMHHASSVIKIGACWALAEEEITPLSIIPDFIRELSAPEPEMRQAAARGLAKYRTYAQSGLPGLTNLLTDPNREVRRAATNAINGIVILENIKNTNDVLHGLAPGMSAEEIVAKLGSNYSVVSGGDHTELWTYKLFPTFSKEIDMCVTGARFRLKNNRLEGCVFVLEPRNHPNLMFK